MGYYTPDTVPDALKALRQGDATIIAGCTDYFPTRSEPCAPTSLVDITRVAGLRGVSQTADGWKIGAATTWSDVIKADLPCAFDGLKMAAREVGSVQIQNAGTLVGNLCNASPAADGVPPLLTLGAELEVVSLRGTRRLPLADFITGVRQTDMARDEMVLAIHIPAPEAGARGYFLKLGARKYLVISIAMVSALVALEADGRIATARVAVGACSAVAQRLVGLEAALIGQTIDQLKAQPDIWARHLTPLAPISDVRGSSDYRQQVAGELCMRAVMGAIND